MYQFSINFIFKKAQLLLQNLRESLKLFRITYAKRASFLNDWFFMLHCQKKKTGIPGSHNEMSKVPVAPASKPGKNTR